MDHFIDSIDIQNFKSIRQLHIAGLNRINLLIGRPNVGKSNILEALGLFGIPFVANQKNNFTDLMRLTHTSEIFFDGNKLSPSFIKIIFDKNIHPKNYLLNISIGFENVNFDFKVLNYPSFNRLGVFWEYVFDENFDYKYSSSSEGNISPPIDFIKRYTFRVSNVVKDIKKSGLLSPFGQNLLYTLEFLPELRETFGSWFNQYGLRLVLDRTTQSLKVMKDKGSEVFILPYSSIADTLQRVIFYKTAIRSNENSVLIFEEPEAHAYPPYISEFTQEVIQSKTNQFFIATHSPFVVDDFLLNAIEELSILMVDFKDGQTAVRSLTQEELHEVRTYGIDLFFNSKRYPV